MTDEKVIMSDSGASIIDQLGGAVHPAKRSRSRRTRDRLITADLKQIKKQRFDEISIAWLAAAAGCSAGTFYFRFSDNDDFSMRSFSFILRSV